MREGISLDILYQTASNRVSCELINSKILHRFADMLLIFASYVTYDKFSRIESILIGVSLIYLNELHLKSSQKYFKELKDLMNNCLNFYKIQKAGELTQFKTSTLQNPFWVLWQMNIFFKSISNSTLSNFNIDDFARNIKDYIQASKV